MKLPPVERSAVLSALIAVFASVGWMANCMFIPHLGIALSLMVTNSKDTHYPP
ncbi:hypothetical protein BS50DRAFT_568927 [Corynespora cassiicola Philippines]|uniref:Uncharacterized protein n=1 Tax=Corynespora cassiicola Philippines TaxID=1448308 RepID=A0A2T2P6U3_CORCC|nr:hypothetical protein BS50DRAFT_568927 [Corynespora cassiicola Philippines]